MSDFIPIPELPVFEEKSRWDLFNAFRDTLIKLVAVSDQTEDTWTRMNLLNGWQHYGAPYGEAGYRKVDNMVYLTGVILGLALDEVAYNMPQLYRPSVTRYFPVATDNLDSAAFITIDRNGNIEIPTGCSLTLTSFDGIVYRAER
jgi:hypothetical protein